MYELKKNLASTKDSQHVDLIVYSSVRTRACVVFTSGNDGFTIWASTRTFGTIYNHISGDSDEPSLLAYTKCEHRGGLRPKYRPALLDRCVLGGFGAYAISTFDFPKYLELVLTFFGTLRCPL